MAIQIDNLTASYQANAALEPWRCCVINSSKTIDYSSAGGTVHGVTQNRTNAVGDPVAVKFKKSSGTHRVNISGTCSAGASLYAAANGQLSTTVSGSIVATALEACSATGGTIEVLFS